VDPDEDSVSRAVWRPPAAEVEPAARHRVVRAIVATALSLLLPGAGQLLNKTWTRAAIIFVIWVAAWVTHLKPVWMFMVLFSGFEAGWTAARQRPRRPDDTPP
jgi:hypothetical protein